MRKRDINLDFTSLLDVIMIILFFFILFSTFEIESAKNEAKQTKEEYKTKISEMDEQQEKLDEEWEKIRQVDAFAQKNQQALSDLQQIVFSINLTYKAGHESLYLNIQKGEEKIIEFDYVNSDDAEKIISDTLKNAGLKEDEVAICTLTYDGNEFYTAKAVDKICKVMNELQMEYNNLYFAAINTSK